MSLLLETYVAAKLPVIRLDEKPTGFGTFENSERVELGVVIAHPDLSVNSQSHHSTKLRRALESLCDRFQELTPAVQQALLVVVELRDVGEPAQALLKRLLDSGDESLSLLAARILTAKDTTDEQTRRSAIRLLIQAIGASQSDADAVNAAIALNQVDSTFWTIEDAEPLVSQLDRIHGEPLEGFRFYVIGTADAHMPADREFLVAPDPSDATTSRRALLATVLEGFPDTLLKDADSHSSRLREILLEQIRSPGFKSSHVDLRNAPPGFEVIQTMPGIPNENEFRGSAARLLSRLPKADDAATETE